MENERILYEGTLLGRAVMAVNAGKIGVYDLDPRYAVHKYAYRRIAYADHLACQQAAQGSSSVELLAGLLYNAIGERPPRRPLTRRGGRRSWRRVY